MNRNKKLLSNSLVFVVGNLGSKLISFIMVPLYTYYLTTKQFGTVDLMLTTINLCLPLVSLSLFDAVFRFAMDKDISKSKVLSTGFFATIAMLAILALISPMLRLFNIPSIGLLILILSTATLFSMFQNFIRAIGYSRVFAFSGIINTALFALLNVILIVAFHGGVTAYLQSYFFAMIIAVMYVFLRTKLWNYLNFDDFSWSLMKKMLMYSVPLIPNALAWWFTNDSSRFFILAFVGVSANGLFAAANKIPSIINMFFNVFTQAWQISAVDEFNSSDSSDYYSVIFERLQQFLFLLFAVLIFLIKPIINLLFSSSYYISWHYVPILLLSVVFADITSFLGSAYLAAKKTVGIFTTTVYGMIINVIVSGYLTSKIGIYGAGVGMSLGFLAVIFLRLCGVRKYINIKMPWFTFLGSLGTLGVMCIGLYSKMGWISEGILILGLVANMYVNRDILFVFVGEIKNVLKKFHF